MTFNSILHPRRTNGIILIVVFISLFALKTARAIEPEEVPVVKRASGTPMEKVFVSLNLKLEEVDHNVYAFEADGYTILLFIAESDIRLMAGFKGYHDISLNRVNDWNRECRFCRAFVDREGDAILEADLDFAGGMTYDTLISFIKRFEKNVGAFARHIE